MAAIKPEDDFQGYMEAREQAARDELEYEARMARHSEWRETTWAGFMVRQVQALGAHFAPFFTALASLMRNDSNTGGGIAVMIVIRLLVIFFAIGMVYIGASLLQRIIGTEYEVVEEIIIVEGEEEEEQEQDTPKEAKKDK